MLHRLADLGNTVVVIEHNLDVIKTADWIIDLGPEAGLGGGDLVAEGTPEEIVDGRGRATPRGSSSRCSTPARWPSGPGSTPRPPPEAGDRGASGGPGRRRAPRPAARPEGPQGQRTRPRGRRDRAERQGPLGGRRPEVAHPRPRRRQRPPGALGRPDPRDGRRPDRGDGAGGGFAPTEWSQRGVVRIKGQRRDEGRFPFFHATTSSRVGRHPAVLRPEEHLPRQRALEKQLALVPFHQVEPPVLSDLPRLRINDLGPFQEITIVGHAAADFETDGFDAFLNKAVAAFLSPAKTGKLKKASEL